jgi:NADH-quinone oxidoreductase subunit G
MPETPAPENPATVNVSLDGRPVVARAGEMLISAAERAGTYIPRFCYHPRMKPVGMCRMCLVELKGPRGFSLQPACFVPVTEGMEVVTDSQAVKKAQDGVLEFLLINHPLDCPVCDKGGECPLQDQTLAYGPGETRFVEEKRHWDKPVPISPLVQIDRERCIQCARCTRFAEEVAGEPGIDLAGRSDATEVADYPGRGYSSNFSGNVVQICPVGALLAKPYRFRARPWDLEQVETTCTMCALGCRVAAQSSAGEVVRFLGVDSDPVNWGWLCDKGRFLFEALNSPRRLAYPLARRGAAPGNGSAASSAGARTPLLEVSWSAALSEVVAHLAEAKGDRIGVIGGARLANEDAYAWSKLARAILATDNVDAQLGDGLPADLVAGLPRATIDEACSAPLVLLVGPDVKEELPVLYLRLRHAAREGGTQLVEVSPARTGLTGLCASSLHYRPGELAALAKALSGREEVTADVAGVPAAEVEAARALIVAAPKVVVVLGRPSLAEPPGAAAQAALILASRPGVAFLPALRRANVHGAIDFGLAPGLLPGRVSLAEGRPWFLHHWGFVPEQPGLSTLGMLDHAAAGRMDVLILLGADPVSDCPDRALAERALEKARFVVAVDAFETASNAHADVVLPAAVYTERRGSTTNIEGRVSWLGQKVTPPGTARPDWMIAAEIATRLGRDIGCSSLADIWAEIRRVSPLHAAVEPAFLMSYQGRDGMLVGSDAAGAAPARVAPLDPMAAHGISSAELHPAPPLELKLELHGLHGASPAPAGSAPASVAVEEGRSEKAGSEKTGSEKAGSEKAGSEEGGLSGTAPSPPRRIGIGDLEAAGTTDLPAPARGAAAGASPAGASPAPGSTLRLVVYRPMWDGGTLVQESPSVKALHPPFTVALHPGDLARLGVAAGGAVRLASRRGSLVAPVVARKSVLPGTAVVPFNVPGGAVAELIEAASAWTEVTVEAVEAGS